MIASDKYTMILFLSPSAFHGFLKLCHPVLKQKRYRLGCIGETTASVIRAAGFVPDLVAGGKGIENLTNHIERQYNGILT
jgi:uroporphyrinogen-III synthase